MQASSQHPRFLYDLTHCGIRRALEAVGDTWTLLILREAIYGVRRFDDFARALGCGRGVLSDRLKRLVAEGVMARQAYAEPGRRPRADYQLTPKGEDLFGALLMLSQWSERWSPGPDGPVAIAAERSTGRPVRAIMTADPRAQALSMADLRITLGPGAKRIA
jgi:DNA-binding HxlR family transcriptional regulator